MAPSANSEDALAKTFDSCVADTIIKIGIISWIILCLTLFLFNTIHPTSKKTTFDIAFKIGGGMATGVLFSLFLFKRKQTF
jgi:hypothetical protein